MSDPKLLVFLCHWCSYGAADHAGGLKLEYPAGVRLIRVHCSGRIDPQMIFHAFESGADGVMVLGCRIGDCHYKTGNILALNRANLLAPLLNQMGIQHNRFRIDFLSANEGKKFAGIINEQYDKLLKIGPMTSHNCGERITQ